MTLTSELANRNSAIRRFLDTRVPSTRAVRTIARRAQAEALDQPPLLPVIPEGGRYPWQVVGTAVDYRVRYLLGPASKNESLAARGVREMFAPFQKALIEHYGLGQDVDPIVVTGYPSVMELVQRLTKRNSARLSRPQEQLLARLTWVLALWEHVYRAGLENVSGIEEPTFGELEDLLDLCPDHVVDDLVEIARRCASVRYLVKRRRETNWHAHPTFSGSYAIGNADADLIVGRRLIEIKTVKDPLAAWAKTLRQLVGYLLLDTEDEYELAEIGIFLPRQGTMLGWDIDELLEQLAGQPTSISELRAEFAPTLAAMAEQRRAFEEKWVSFIDKRVYYERNFYPSATGRGKWHSTEPDRDGMPSCGTKTVLMLTADPIRPARMTRLAEVDARFCSRCVQQLGSNL